MKSIKNRKMKGSVLLTVVSVMALLIIFLFGTLVLATAANNRAHVNYSTAQTNITARTVVNTAYNAIAKNKDYADAITALSSTNTTLDIPVTISSSGTNVNTLGHLDSLTAEYAGTRKFYNATQKKWQDCDLVKITAEATMNGITTTSSAYIVKDPPSPPPGGGGGGAGFVTTGSADFTCKTNLFGGSYVNLPKLADSETYNYLAGYNTYSGNYLSGKTFTFDNDGSLIEADTVVNGNLMLHHLTAMRFPGQGQGMTVWGDMLYDDNTFDKIKNVTSNLTLTSPATIDFNKMPYIYVDGTLGGSVRIGPFLDGGTSQFPFNIFAGNLEVQKNAYSNNAKFAMSGDIYLMNDAQTNILKPGATTELYSWTASVINKSGDSAVSKVQGNIYSKGNFVVGGQQTIKLKSLYIDGDLNVDDLEGKLDMSGDLVVNGAITGNLKNEGKIEVAGDVYADSVSLTGKHAAAFTGASNANIEDIDDYSGVIYPEYAERDVILGERQLKDASNNDIPVEKTKVVKKMDEVLKNVINPYDSEDLPPAMQTKRTQLLANDDKKIANEAQAIAKLGTSFTKCTGWWDSANKQVKLTYDDTATMNHYWPVIKESCVLTGSMSNNYPEKWDGIMRSLILDPGAGEMLVILDGFNEEISFLVNDSQGGTVYIYVMPDTTATINYHMYSTKFLQLFKNLKLGDADGDSTNGAQTSIQFFTDSSYAMSGPVPFTDDSLELSVPSTALKYSPGIRIYGGRAPDADGEHNAELIIRNFSVVTAQINSPYIKFTANSTELDDTKGYLIKNTDIYYNGYKVNTKDQTAIFGCLNTKSSSFPNQANMIYVPDLNKSYTPIILPDSTHWFEMLYYDEY